MRIRKARIPPTFYSLDHERIRGRGSLRAERGRTQRPTPDINKCKGQVPKIHLANGLLDTLNDFDATANYRNDSGRQTFFPLKTRWRNKKSWTGRRRYHYTQGNFALQL
jgi:hypothetical protein